MNENIKAMCLELAELALETKGVDVAMSDYYITVFHYSYKDEKVETISHNNIHFLETDAEERIKKALDYVRSLGGDKDE